MIKSYIYDISFRELSAPTIFRVLSRVLVRDNGQFLQNIGRFPGGHYRTPAQCFAKPKVIVL